MTQLEKLTEIMEGRELGWNHSKLIRLENFLSEYGVKIGGLVRGSDELIFKYQDTCWLSTSITELLDPDRKTWKVSSDQTTQTINHRPILDVDSKPLILLIK